MTLSALSPLATALLAVLTTASLVAMYFLKLRRRRMVIASSVLWKRILDRHEARSLWDKLRWLASMLLAVTIGLLLVFAVARPEIAAFNGANGKTLIVMDTSPSMLARMSDGRTRWQHAVDIAKTLVSSGASGSEFRIADTSGQFDAPFTNDIHAIQHSIENIESMRPLASTARFPDFDSANSSAVFISDGVAAPPVPSAVRKRIVYEAAKNVGITAFEVRNGTAWLEVTNFGQDVRKTSIHITEGGPGRISRDVEIPPGQSFSDTLDLSSFEGGALRAAIQSESDAFPSDDIAYDYLPMKRKTKTLLVTKGDSYLQAALKLDASVDISVADPKAYREDPAIDAYIFDGFAPAAQPAKPALIFGAPDVPWLPRPVGSIEKTSITTWTENNPVMQYLSLHDVSIAKASVLDASNVTVLASGGQTPLLVASLPGRNPRWILAAFDLQASDFPLHESFPLFIDNALAWLGRDRPALHRTIGVVEVPIVDAQITRMDGKAVASHRYMERTVFEAPEPGLYVATKDGQRQYIAVNLMGREYSNINQAVATRSDEAKPASHFFRHEPWFYLVFLAVVLLGLEWFTYHRRVTL